MAQSKALQQFVKKAKREGLPLDDYATLKPWEFTFAHYLVNDPRKSISVREQLEVATKIAGAEISKRQLARTRANKAFQRYRTALAADASEAAMQRAKAAAPDMIDKHVNAAGALYEQGEYKSIAQFTQPFIDRVWPKKEDTSAQQVVNVVLSVKQAEAINEEIPEVEYEVIDDGNSDS